MEEWHIPGKTASKQVCYRLQTRTVERLSTRHQTVLVTFLDSESHFTAVQKECTTPPHVQIRHTTWLSFTRPSPALVLQATNTGVRKPGYEATIKVLITATTWYNTSTYVWAKAYAWVDIWIARHVEGEGPGAWECQKEASRRSVKL